MTEHKSMFESRVTPISIGIAVMPPYLGWSCHRKAQAASDKTMSCEQVVATIRGDSGSRWFRLILLKTACSCLRFGPPTWIEVEKATKTLMKI
ncbi:MAG: hypothetical protein OSA89_06770 [Mariniblastus sp.]|nr:hypothetical protein [Mariniblastus sp.]